MRFGMIIDLNLCSSCGACALACKAENNTRTRGEGQSFNWADFIQETRGVFPNTTQIAIPVMCNHCENPQCVKVCPTGAMFVSPEGVVLHNDETCVGCRLCQNACPYSSAELGPESLDGKTYSVISFNPKGVDPRGDAATRPALIRGATGDAQELGQKAGAVPAVPVLLPRLEQVEVGNQHQGALRHHGQAVHRLLQRAGRHLLSAQVVAVELPQPPGEHCLPQAAQVVVPQVGLLPVEDIELPRFSFLGNYSEHT